MATDLETRPLEFGMANLTPSGWTPGKHAPPGESGEARP